MADPVCDDNNGSSPYVCVNKSGNPPQHGVHFVFDFSDPAKPDVTFWTGDDNWVVWSQVSETNSTPADLGDLKIDPTVGADNFGVRIANGTNPGAANVESIVLDDPNHSGWSLLASGSKTTGNVNGNITVVVDGSGGGGSISLEVAGKVTRIVLAPCE